ncbi:MAG: type II toxin-antitoxin system RelE/ParE family toxin [Patescibacteria group bacterium]|jgi:proteic killer suppression protein
MIQSFADADTKHIFQRDLIKRFPTWLQKIALRKLLHIHAAHRLDDLKVPPGNRLEKLKGKDGDKHSIRVNDQWRLRFKWKDSDAYEVCLIDYHD